MTESARQDDAAGADGWERWSRGPLVILSVLVLVAFSILVLVPGAAPWFRSSLLVVIGVAWGTFIVDYAARLAASDDRGRFVRRNALSLASALVPVVRPFDLLRFLHRVRGFGGDSGRSLRSRFVAYAAASAVFFVYVVSLAELWVERDAPGATIRTFGDALWWASETMSTVGYGDVYPVTAVGRMLGVILMGAGFALIAVSSALLVSYLAERVAAADSRRRD